MAYQHEIDFSYYNGEVLEPVQRPFFFSEHERNVQFISQQVQHGYIHPVAPLNIGRQQAYNGHYGGFPDKEETVVCK